MAGHNSSVDDQSALGVAIVTVASDRDLDHDTSGDVIVTALQDSDYQLITRDLVPDNYDKIQAVVDATANRRDVQSVITVGGTSIGPKGLTIDAIRPLFQKELPGFGEFFRRQAATEVGLQAMATRTTAGVINETLVFSLPDHPAAVTLGIEDLIFPELDELVALVR